MIKPKKILYPTDFSRCATQAFSQAHNLAKAFSAELHILHGIVLHDDDPHHPAYLAGEEIHKRVSKTAEDEMDSLLRAYHTEGMPIVKAQLRGISVAPVILEYTKENDIDLIVMGTHGRRGLAHMFLGSASEEVVRLAPCPVFTVREREHPQPITEIEAILVPVDFSEHSEVAVKNGLQFARMYDASLQLLHVVEETVHPSFYASGKTSIFEFVPDIKNKSEAALDQLIGEFDHTGVDYEKYIVEGRAAIEIVDFAAKHASDLIVISTHGLTGIERLLMGSVTEKVVRTAPCPVLTLKAFANRD